MTGVQTCALPIYTMPENKITANEHFLNICLFGRKHIIKIIVAYWPKKKKKVIVKSSRKRRSSWF